MSLAQLTSEVGVGPVRFVAVSSTSSFPPANIDLAEYGRNPVVVWSHDLERLPVGRGRVWVRDGALFVDVWFDSEDSFARRVERKYRRGFLHAVSVGLRRAPELCLAEDGVTIDSSRQRWILEEISCCVVPKDAHAVIVRADSNGYAGGGHG